MSVKIGALLNSLLLKAGVKNDHPELINLLSKSEFANTEINKELADALEKNLLTPESALASPLVRPKLFAQALNGIDSEIESTLDELGFDDIVKTSIKGIQGNTNERLRQLKAETKKLIEKAAKQTDKGDIEAANKTIKELNDKLATINNSKKEEIDALTNKHRSEIRDVKLETLLSGKNYPNKDLPQDVNVLTAKHLIGSDLARKGYKLELDDAGQWVLKTKEGTDVFVDNKQVSPTSYIDAVLAENKFIAVNTPPPSGIPGGQGSPFGMPPGTPPAPSNQQVVAEIDSQLAQLNS